MINIVDNIYLDADTNCLILVEWNGTYDKRGDLQGARRRYFSEPVALLNSILKILIRRAVVVSSDLQELNDRIESINNIIDEASSRLSNMCRSASGMVREQLASNDA